MSGQSTNSDLVEEPLATGYAECGAPIGTPDKILQRIEPLSGIGVKS
jgi:hypothetical protein